MKFPSISEDPQRTDSPDLTDEEIASASDTPSQHDWVQSVLQEIGSSELPLVSQEVRRRGDDLYVRTTLQDSVTKKVLVARTNWLGKTS